MVLLLWQFILRLAQKPIYRLFSLNYPGKLLKSGLEGLKPLNTIIPYMLVLQSLLLLDSHHTRFALENRVEQ